MAARRRFGRAAAVGVLFSVLACWGADRAWAAAAPERGPVRVAVVDFDKIRKTSQFDRTLFDMQALRERALGELENIGVQIKTFEAQRAPISRGEKRYIELTRKIEELQDRLMILKRRREREYRAHALNLFRRFYGSVELAIKTVAEGEGYDVVLQVDESHKRIDDPDALLAAMDSRKVLYASSRADITDKVLAELERLAAVRENPDGNAD
jgi:Skp family chaperone for outer membrane proteins